MSSRPLRLTLLVLGDLAVFSISLAIAIYLRAGGHPDPVVIHLYFWAGPILFLLWLAGFIMFGLYDLKLAKNDPIFFDRLTRAIALNFVVTIFLFYAIPAFGLRPLGTLIILFPAIALFSFSWRNLYNAVLTRQSKERILFLGVTDEVLELVSFLNGNPQLGFESAAYVEIEPGSAKNAPHPVLPQGANLANIIRDYKITTVVAAHNLKRTKTLILALFEVVPLGIAVTDFPRFFEAVRGKVPASLISETWFLENLVGTRRPRYEFGKRALDIVLAIAIGLITLILFPLIACAVLLSTPRDILQYRHRRARLGDGVILFRQERVGKNGRSFEFIKFRSQILGAELLGHEKGETVDPRAYWMGTFLRKTYLDELPQLWNVLRGDMSFIGPRPERPKFVRELELEIPFYRMRELVLPGITGWSQINMENDQSVSDAPEKMQYDLFYIKNRSIALDITILLKTILKVLQRSGR
jgi:exopolysaccharide biosynthesis polyprenyl glycosylphosphotransferase